MQQEPAKLLRVMFNAAVDAASPVACLPPHLPSPPKGRTIVIGAGKAAATMASVVEDNWDGLLEGLVVTRYSHAVPCERIEVVEASHPVPDAARETTARRILEMLSNLSADDLVLALISGGGSSLLSLAAEGVTLEDKQGVNRALLKCGASIGQMNCVRKHLSAIKGGRLAARAHPAKVVSLLISDVPGDDASVIASGPTVPDPSTFADALDILQTYDIDAPQAVIDHLHRGEEETPKPEAPCFDGNEVTLIATPQRSLDAARAVAAEAGIRPLILSDISNNKGVKVPGVIPPISALSDKDREDLASALEIGVDWVTLVFVQRPEDVTELKDLVAGRACVMVKLEKPSTMAKLAAIVEVTDAVMVARGVPHGALPSV